MKIEHFGMAEPGDCRLVLIADAAELASAVAAERAKPNAPHDEDDLQTAAINAVLLNGFSPLYAELVEAHKLVPLTDPDFELLSVDAEGGFRAGAEFYCMPPMELDCCTGFTQQIQPRPIRRLTIELEINRRYGDEERAADEVGKQELRRRVAQEICTKRCEQAKALAEQALLQQLGAHVSGSLPKQLVADNYFVEQRAFNLRMQANGINFDQYLKVRGQTVEQFRTWLHESAEQKLRSRIGLLLVADKENLCPTQLQVQEALSAWDDKKYGEHTFPSNDERKVRQKIASDRAAAFVLAHSTLLPPPNEPVIQEISTVV